MMGRRYKRRSRNKGARWGSRIAKVGNIAYNGFKIASTLASLINTEWKSFDRGAMSGASIDNAGSMTRLSAITQGDDKDDRDGNSILPKRIQVALNFFVDATATASEIRCILLMDKEFDGVAPTVAEVLETVRYDSWLNRANAGKFRILKNIRVNVNTTDKVTQKYKMIVNLNKPNKNPHRMKKRFTHIRYSGPTDGLGDGRQNQVYLLLLSNEATNTPTVDAQFRIWYIDN